MTPSSSIIYLLFSACQFIVLLRFICQISKVNYYNPVTQSVIKLSGYLLKPFEILSITQNTYILFFLLYAFTFLKLYMPLIINGELYPLESLSIISFGYLIRDLLNIYWYLIIISAIKSWFNVFVSHPIFNLIDELCDPLYNYVRRLIPSASGIDFSPVIILVVVQILEIVFVPRIFNLTSML